MKETNFTFHKQYFVGLLFLRNAKETHTGQMFRNVFTLSEKFGLRNLQKRQPQKTISHIRTFTILGLIARTALKFTSTTKYKFLGYRV